MFYNKYSNYSYEQIVEDTPLYKQISDKLLEKSASTTHMEKMKRHFV